MSIDRLLCPKTIAVVGGGAWCENVLVQCQKMNFSGEIWPVHPTRTKIAGIDTFSDVDELPQPPDATFIGVNRKVTVEIVRKLSDAGSGGAICFASGFREAQKETGDGVDLQRQLVEAAKDMTIIGPNCYGLVNYLDGVALWPDQHGGVRCDTGVAIITQSSNIAINLTMQKRGLPIAYVVTAGNQAQTDLSEIGMAMLDDPRVTALGLHIEGINDTRAFEALAAKAKQLAKPIVAIKVGKSEQARSATISHTASLAGSDAGASALMKRLGIGRATSLSSLLETLKLLHIAGPMRTGEISSMSCSGGEASLFADSIQGTPLRFPSLTRQQNIDLRQALGPMIALANPLDYHTFIWGDQAAMAKVFAAMLDPGISLGCIVVDFPRSDRCCAADWDLVIEAAHNARAEKNIPVALLSSLPENMPEEVAQKIIERGLIPFCGFSEAIEAMSIASDLGPVSEIPIIQPRRFDDHKVLSEFEGKQMLAGNGVKMPKNRRVTSPAGLKSALENLKFPVVLKGEGIEHKSEAGAVALNLNTQETVMAAAERMPTQSFLIEEMIDDAICELLVGVVCDPVHGYVLTIGAGGVLTEILSDSASLLIPAAREDIKEAVLSLKISPVLIGFRGKDPVNIDAVIDTVLGLQSFVMDNPVVEAEINPLICTNTTAIACDALIKMGLTS